MIADAALATRNKKLEKKDAENAELKEQLQKLEAEAHQLRESLEQEKVTQSRAKYRCNSMITHNLSLAY